ncbi:hypothetical protein VHP8226_03815 [Vibrio hippocampi]|uniref:Uncharacterized protein n=1 Tax=Vibrio hippocampi TaxID=654686 RepID=A0ABN8DMW5_9VIBR|nr:hypothetical protein VHP8226_03815 [Vibrio hippocampi]
MILLIPICLLLLVIVAGVYRFSLSDEEILQKFPDRASVASDPVVEAVLGISTKNPWTIKVPESNAFSLLTDVDEKQQIAYGNYDDGQVRGQVTVHYAYLHQWQGSDKNSVFIAPFSLSNQGSGIFYYLGIFKWDTQRQRVILVNQQFVGDRISLGEITISQSKIRLSYLTYGPSQPFSESPEQRETLSCNLLAEQELIC